MLICLPAPGLPGSRPRAYSLLTRLISQIGWDDLLKARSSVSVMEEEYRLQDGWQTRSIYVGCEWVRDPIRIVIYEDKTVSYPRRVDFNVSTRVWSRPRLRLDSDPTILRISYGRGKGGVSALFGYSQVCIFCFRRRHLSRIRLIYHRSGYPHRLWNSNLDKSCCVSLCKVHCVFSPSLPLVSTIWQYPSPIVWDFFQLDHLHG